MSSSINRVTRSPQEGIKHSRGTFVTCYTVRVQNKRAALLAAAEREELASQAADLFDGIHRDQTLYRRLLRKCMRHAIAPELFDDTQKKALLHNMAHVADLHEERSERKIHDMLREQHRALVAKVLFALDAVFHYFPKSRHTKMLRRNVRACQESVNGKLPASTPSTITTTMDMLRQVLSAGEAPPPTPSATLPPERPPRGTIRAPARYPRTPPDTPPPAPLPGATGGNGEA